jgi:hypothetical protein
MMNRTSACIAAQVLVVVMEELETVEEVIVEVDTVLDVEVKLLLVVEVSVVGVVDGVVEAVVVGVEVSVVVADVEHSSRVYMGTTIACVSRSSVSQAIGVL